jgi:hypothetical protein
VRALLCPSVKKILPAALLLTNIAVFCCSYSDSEWDPVIYSGTFFVLLEESDPLDPHNYNENDAIKRLLEEAQWVFSSMIYGFRFEYIPYDKARGVVEEYTLEPVHQIPWGDPGMTITNGRYESGVYYADISYKVSEPQLPWVHSWESNILNDIISIGTGSLFSGIDGKIDSIRNTVKQALRDHLRPQIYNKPRKISGAARLSSVPTFAMTAGEYRCKARVTLNIDEILEYRIY